MINVAMALVIVVALLAASLIESASGSASSPSWPICHLCFKETQENASKICPDKCCFAYSQSDVLRKEVVEYELQELGYKVVITWPCYACIKVTETYAKQLADAAHTASHSGEITNQTVSCSNGTIKLEEGAGEAGYKDNNVFYCDLYASNITKWPAIVARDQSLDINTEKKFDQGAMHRACVKLVGDTDFHLLLRATKKDPQVSNIRLATLEYSPCVLHDYCEVDPEWNVGNCATAISVAVYGVAFFCLVTARWLS